MDSKILRDEKLENTTGGQKSLSDEPVELSAALNRRITRKFDLHLLPFLFGLWLLAFIDRSNIGNARIDGLPKDLHLGTGNKFSIALTIFYVPYICVDVPSNWILKYVGAG